MRAPDRGPVLYQVAGALAGSGLTITAALINTLGAEVIDVFYVQTVGGGQVVDAAEQQGLTAAVAAAAVL